jgi:protein-L-isoaspartate O-methyltransferase
MQTTAQRWEVIYNQIPLCNVPSHFAGMRNYPFLLQYLAAVLRLCPRGGRTLETGIGTGYGAIFLSQRGIKATVIDYSAGIVERCRLVNNILQGKAPFHFGDLFDLYENEAQSRRYDVIYNQGLLEQLCRANSP